MDKLKENCKEFLKDYILIVKSQQRCKSEAHIVVTEEVNKIALCAIGERRIQSIDCRETCIWNK